MPEHRIDYTDSAQRPHHQWIEGDERLVGEAIALFVYQGYEIVSITTTDETAPPEGYQRFPEVPLAMRQLGRKHREEGRTLDQCPFLNPINREAWAEGWREQDEAERNA